MVPCGLESTWKKVPGCIWVLCCHVCISLPDFSLPPPPTSFPHSLPRSGVAAGAVRGRVRAGWMLQGGLLHLQSQVGTLVCRVSLLESGSQGRLTAVPSEIPNASRLFTAAARISCSQGRCLCPKLVPWRAHPPRLQGSATLHPWQFWETWRVPLSISSLSEK